MSTEPPFTDSFQITRDDMVDYLRVAQRTLNTIGMGAGIVGALYGIYLAYLGDTALGIVLLVMGAFLFLASATRYMDRLRAASIGKRIIGTQATLTVGDSGIDSDTVAGNAHVSWSQADNVVESPQTIVLRRGRLTICWIPTRAMGLPAERDAQLEYIRAHVGAPPGTPIYERDPA
ncbi:MAG: YcxB family protein [Chloroflexota bacterium]